MPGKRTSTNTEKSEKEKKERLPAVVQRFIVRHLARFETPTDVVRAVREEFKRVITKQGVQYYDPAKRASEQGLSEQLTDLFWETREKFLEDEAANLRSLKYRLGVRALMINKSLAKGNYPLVDALLVNAAKDEGGAFTNRRELTGRDGAPIALSVEDRRRELAAKMLRNLVEKGTSEQEARDYLLKMGVDEQHLPAVQRD